MAVGQAAAASWRAAVAAPAGGPPTSNARSDYHDVRLVRAVTAGGCGRLLVHGEGCAGAERPPAPGGDACCRLKGSNSGSVRDRDHCKQAALAQRAARKAPQRLGHL